MKTSLIMYKVIQKIYYSIRKIIETHITGTSLQECIWKTRHITKGKAWAEGYSDTIDHPHRKLVINKILKYAPFRNILEVGCNMGPNLILLSRELKNVQLYGIDINSYAVEVGKSYFKQNGIKNIQLMAGKAHKLNRFGNKFFDVSFTDATLIYIGPDRITKVLKEMERITRKVLIFNEWHTEFDQQYYDGHWVYNYKKLIRDNFPEAEIIINKLPISAWNDVTWNKFGAIIEIQK
jgi:ubiquinone/menaquinone biosynthesis C-methylase UbiE